MRAHAPLAIVDAFRHTPTPHRREREPIRLKIKPVLQGGLGRLFVGISAFELGNCAATMMIRRATDLLEPGHGTDDATTIAIALYVVYNLSATVTSIAAGKASDRRTPPRARRRCRWRSRSRIAGRCAELREPRRQRHRWCAVDCSQPIVVIRLPRRGDDPRRHLDRAQLVLN